MLHGMMHSDAQTIWGTVVHRLRERAAIDGRQTFMAAERRAKLDPEVLTGVLEPFDTGGGITAIDR